MDTSTDIKTRGGNPVNWVRSPCKLHHYAKMLRGGEKHTDRQTLQLTDGISLGANSVEQIL